MASERLADNENNGNKDGNKEDSLNRTESKEGKCVSLKQETSGLLLEAKDVDVPDAYDF